MQDYIENWQKKKAVKPTSVAFVCDNSKGKKIKLELFGLVRQKKKKKMKDL